MPSINQVEVFGVTYDIEGSGGGGADNTFVVTPGGIAGITDTPTPFLDIKVAFQANKVIQAHGIVNGQGVYGYLQDFMYDETTGKGSIVFAFSNSNPNYMNGVDFIITCNYDASASPTDTWQQDAQMPIPAPTASDANKVLKVNGSGNAVGWDKVKSSELENDSGFIDTATFTAIYNMTPFADIQQAIAEGKCVKCDVSGYTYELVHVLSTKITFALTNNVDGNISQETVWVTSDDEWDGESVNVAKASDVPTKTSDLTNDSGFLNAPEGESESGFVMTPDGWTETFVALYGLITTDMDAESVLQMVNNRSVVMLYDISSEDYTTNVYHYTGFGIDITTYDYVLNFVGSVGTATAYIGVLNNTIRWEFKNTVKSTEVTSIVKVTAMPENPDPNTLYLVVEEPTTTSEVE